VRTREEMAFYVEAVNIGSAIFLYREIISGGV